MNPIEIHTTLIVADWRAYQAAWCEEAKARPLPQWQSVLLWLVIALIVSWLIQGAGPGAWLPFVSGAAVVTGSCWLQARRIRKLSEPDADAGVLGPCTLCFDTQGVHAIRPLARASYDWRSIRRVSASPEHLFLWVDRLAALIVPLRDVPPETRTQLQALVQQKGIDARAGISAEPAVSVGAVAAIAEGLESAARPASLREFIIATCRLLTVRMPASTAFNLSDGKLAGLSAFYISGWLLIERVRSGTTAVFDWDGIFTLAWQVLVIVLLAGLLARSAEPRVAFRNTFALALALLPLYALGSWAALTHPRFTWLIGLAGALYAHHCLQRGLQSLTGRWQRRVGQLGLVMMFVVVWVGTQTYAQPRLWYASNDDDDAASWNDQRADAEALLYRQSSLIDAAVARMERPTQLEAAGFFVGFAGVGEQSVFATEIALAQRRIGQHFGTDARSLRLVNDARDLQSQPLASPSGLGRALTAIAARMDLQHDVLFLALSSHGSSNAEISVSNGVLPLNDLSAETLVQSLRAAGIRRKVIIVSACYSGTFIAPLKDPDTIIITAAAADRTSFGCANDRELTYFGEAFYRDALERNGDLRRAFELAKAQIAQREVSEGKRASNPQAYFGPELEAYLRGWTGSKPQRSPAINQPAWAE